MADEKGKVQIPISLPGAAQAAADAGKVAAGLKQVETATENVAQASAEATSATKETTQAVKAETTAGQAVAATEKEVAAAKEKTTAASRRQAQQTRDTGKEISSLGEVSEKGIGIGRALGAAVDSNWLAFANLTAMLKVTGAALRTNLIGMGVLAVTALVNALPSLIARFKGTAQEAKSMGDTIAEALKKGGDAKDAALEKTLKGIETGAKTAADELQRVMDLRAKLREATAAADRAEVENNPDLTATERATRQAEIENRTVAQARRDEEVQRGKEYAAAEKKKDETAAAQRAAEEEQKKFERNAQAPGRIDEERASLRAELASLQRKTGGTSAEAMARGDRMAEITKRLGVLDKERAAFETDDGKKYLEAQRERARQAKAATEKAAAEATAAKAEYDRINETVSEIRPDGSAVLSREERKIREQQDRERRSRQRRSIVDAWDKDDAEGKDVPFESLQGSLRIYEGPKPAFPSVDDFMKPGPRRIIKDAASIRAQVGEDAVRSLVDGGASPAGKNYDLLARTITKREPAPEAQTMIQELIALNKAVQENTGLTWKEIGKLQAELRATRQQVNQANSQLRAGAGNR